MFTLTIAVGNASWPLVFKSEEHAHQAYIGLIATGWGSTTIVDDFGQQALIFENRFHGALLEDMEKVKLAHIERMIYSNHLQIDANARANSDTKIRLAKQGGGPAIVTPFGNGPRPLS